MIQRANRDEKLFSPDVVTIWVGAFPDEPSLLHYLAATYTDDGDSSSQFRADFHINYDEDFAEASYGPDLIGLLSHHSYGTTIHASASTDISFHPDANSLYLIYNIDASALHTTAGRLTLLGSYTYNPPAL